MPSKRGGDDVTLVQREADGGLREKAGYRSQPTSESCGSSRLCWSSAKSGTSESRSKNPNQVCSVGMVGLASRQARAMATG
jgi:hypothetical protein